MPHGIVPFGVPTAQTVGAAGPPDKAQAEEGYGQGVSPRPLSAACDGEEFAGWCMLEAQAANYKIAAIYIIYELHLHRMSRGSSLFPQHRRKHPSTPGSSTGAP